MKKLTFLILTLAASSAYATGNIVFTGGGSTSQVIFSSGTHGGSGFGPFAHRQTITISSANVSQINNTALTNFPVLVNSYQLVLTTQTSGGHLQNANGYDLVFTTNSTCNDWNISWDTETINTVGVSTMNVWVNLPSVSTQTSTVFYMCYGNSSITTYQGKSSSTWDSNYIAVFHLPNGSVLTTGDSTTNQTTSTVAGVIASTGIIDGSARIDGNTNSAISIALQNIKSTHTIEGWLQATGGTTAILAGYSTATGDYQFYLTGYTGSDAIYYSSGGGGNNVHVTNTGGITANTWYHWAVTRLDTAIKFFINGVQMGTTQTLATNSDSTLNTIGNTSNGGFAFTGILDEIEISKTNRSSDWINTQYRNQNSPSTFETIGSEQ